MHNFFGVQVLHALQQARAMVASAGKQTTKATDQQAHPLIIFQPQHPKQSRAPLG